MFDAQWSGGYLDPPEGEPYSKEEVISWLNEIPSLSYEILTLHKENVKLEQQNKALIEDAERLAGIAEQYAIESKDKIIDDHSCHAMVEVPYIERALDQHKALKASIEK